MKKLLLIAVLMLALVLAAVACTETPDEPGTSADGTTAETPTVAPTEEPTQTLEEPTEEPTEVPTEMPTEEPTEEPTEKPTEKPTEEPTEEPTKEPTVEPEDPQPLLSIDKTVYKVGESIMVTAFGSGTDWVGIARKDFGIALRWWYLDPYEGSIHVESGSTFDAIHSQFNAHSADIPARLPAGEYVVVIIDDDQSLGGTRLAEVEFTIVADDSARFLDMAYIFDMANTPDNPFAANHIESAKKMMEGERIFTRFKASGGDPYIKIFSQDPPVYLPNYMAISYRNNSGVDTGSFYMGSDGSWTGQGDNFLVDISTDNEWSFLIVDLSATGMTSVVDHMIKFIRWDIFEAKTGEDAWFDLEYIAFFETAEDAEAYYKSLYGEETPEDPENPENPEDPEDPEDPEVSLTIDKTVYKFDEPIMVTAIGSGTDWIGIAKKGENSSMRWWFIDPFEGRIHVGSGVTFDAVHAETNYNTEDPLYPGEYVIVLIDDNHPFASGTRLVEIEFTIVD